MGNKTKQTRLFLTILHCEERYSKYDNWFYVLAHILESKRFRYRLKFSQNTWYIFYRDFFLLHNSFKWLLGTTSLNPVINDKKKKKINHDRLYIRRMHVALLYGDVFLISCIHFDIIIT